MCVQINDRYEGQVEIEVDNKGDREGGSSPPMVLSLSSDPCRAWVAASYYYWFNNYFLINILFCN